MSAEDDQEGGVQPAQPSPASPHGDPVLQVKLFHYHHCSQGFV